MNWNNDLIVDLIEESQSNLIRKKNLYERYKGKQLLIDSKQSSKVSKANNKIKNDYRGKIVDQVVGYLFGKPITFSIDKKNYSEQSYAVLYDELQNFLIRNNVDDLNAESGKKASICGETALYLYIDEEGNERVMGLKPWEYILYKEDGVNISLGIRYYSIFRMIDGEKTEIKKVEVSDKLNTYYFILDDGALLIDPDAAINPRINVFENVPFIEIVNNEEKLGDFEKVEGAIDASDFLLSSVQDEIDNFRMAYMAFYGVDVDDETLEAAKETGAFVDLPPEARIEFITKQLNDTVIQNQKSTLNENIYKFSSSVDMSDEKFSGGGESGESRKWKIIDLENKSVVKERKYSTALRELFRILCVAWNKKGMPINYLDVYWNFHRNLPVDLLYIAQVGAQLKDIVSEETRLSAMAGLVDDIEWEKDQMEEDASAYSLSTNPVNEDEENGKTV